MSEPLLWRAAPFHALRGRQGNRVVSSPLSGERRILPDGVFALLDQLRSFRPFSEHAENALRRMGAAHGHDSDIRKTLEDLRRQGLLISDDEFFRAALPPEPIRSAPISTIAIPTSGRSGLIQRCIDSYAAHAREYGHKVRFVIAGAAAGESSEPIVHLDRPRLENFAAALGRAGIDPAVARFALLGEAADLPSGLARNTGANRNALLLECAGEAFLSVDDDTVCSFTRSPSWRDGLPGRLALHSAASPLEMWFGPDLPSEIAPVDLDFLAELGRSLGPAIRSAMPLSPAEFDHSTLEKLCRGEAKARLVQVGVMGDAATDSPAGWLTAIGPNRERLVAKEAGYRAAMASRRVFMAVPCETVSASRQLMAYCIALDHRELLPPFPPLGRDQDGVFGFWERIMEPDSFTVHVPFAVAHTPAEVRNFPPGDPQPPRGMLLNGVLYFLCEETYPGISTRTPRERMRSLGSGLEEITGLSRAGFEAILLERRLRLLSRSIAYLEAALKQFGSTPAWWVRDIQRFVRSFEEEMAGPDILRFSEPGTSSPEDPLGTHQNYTRWCGRLLREWPGMCEAAMRLRR